MPRVLEAARAFVKRFKSTGRFKKKTPAGGGTGGRFKTEGSGESPAREMIASEARALFRDKLNVRAGNAQIGQLAVG